MECSDVTEWIVKARRHVVGLHNVNKQSVKCSSMKTGCFEDGVMMQFHTQQRTGIVKFTALHFYNAAALTRWRRQIPIENTDRMNTTSLSPRMRLVSESQNLGCKITLKKTYENCRFFSEIDPMRMMGC